MFLFLLDGLTVNSLNSVIPFLLFNFVEKIDNDKNSVKFDFNFVSKSWTHSQARENAQLRNFISQKTKCPKLEPTVDHFAAETLS